MIKNKNKKQGERQDYSEVEDSLASSTCILSASTSWYTWEEGPTSTSWTIRPLFCSEFGLGPSSLPFLGSLNLGSIHFSMALETLREATTTISPKFPLVTDFSLVDSLNGVLIEGSFGIPLSNTSTAPIWIPSSLLDRSPSAKMLDWLH